MNKNKHLVKRFKKSINKKIRNAQTHFYKGINFKSGLELYMYKLLESYNIPFKYEENSYLLEDGFDCISTCYERKKNGSFGETSNKIRKITYTPDFVANDNSFIIETKGLKTDVFTLRYKLFKKYLKTNNIKTMLFLPSNQKECQITMNIIKNKINENK